jgi:uncharacterized protein (DUF1810 family)
MNNDSVNSNDPFGLNRFVQAQEKKYEFALSELRLKQKRSHWMWYIFPQYEGLGHSSMSKRYSIKSVEEAQAYLSHSVLGTRLLECTETVVAIEERSAKDIFGVPDDRKLKSSMTLFDYISESGSVFALVLDKFYGGVRCAKTLQLLKGG